MSDNCPVCQTKLNTKQPTGNADVSTYAYDCPRCGKFFFQENEPGTSMFVLREGRVAILKCWGERSHLVRYLKSGDCFGEMALLDLYPRSASVLAVDRSIAIEIPADSLHQLYQQDLEQFALIFMNIGRELSRRLRDADSRLFEQAMAGKITRPADLPSAI